MSKIKYVVGAQIQTGYSGEWEIDLTEYIDYDFENKYDLQNAIMNNLSSWDIVAKLTEHDDKVYEIDDVWWVEKNYNLDELWEGYLKLKGNE